MVRYPEMNVLFFHTTMGVSGGEIWMADVATRLRDRGHHVLLGTPCGSWMASQAEQWQIPCFDYLLDPEFEPNTRWQLCECLVEEEIDVVLCGIPGALPEAPMLDRAMREAGRGTALLRLGVAPGPGALSRDRVGLGMDTVSGILVVSHDIRERLTREFPDLDPETIHLIYNGVDLQSFDPSAYSPGDRASVRRSLGIPDGHRVVGAVGRLDPIKNLPMLIRGAASVLARQPSTTFVVAGAGGQKESLVGLAREEGVLERFRFPGYVENIPRFLCALDCLVHTARSEGVPNAVLEAMAMEVPVVAAAVGGVPELIDTDESGILVASDDDAALAASVSSLLTHPDRAQRLAGRARQRVSRRFSRCRNIAEVEALLARTADAAVVRNAEAPVLEPPPVGFFPHNCALQRLSS